ncbi:hypothetical protein AAG906_029816 [Vitis piasezkii]
MGFCFSRPRDIPISSSSSSDGDFTNHHYQPIPITSSKESLDIPPPLSMSVPKPPTSSQIGTVLGRPLCEITSIYDIGKELGGSSTGLKYACKSISKRKLKKYLTGQPNIVEFKGAYEDKQNLHLVMELCSYSEREAADICRQIVTVVHVCHFMGVMHRDLKPENFLMVSREENSPLKATDFGLSVFIEDNEVYKDVVGSAYYVAPEVLRRSYGKEIDVWSAGVILYILLSGVPPFWGENEKSIFDAVLQGYVDFDSAPWPSISGSAKDLIKKMLMKDPKRRITASDALNHPWLREDGEASDKPIDSAVLVRMKQFRAMNKLKKLALKVIAENLSEEDIKGLKQMFNNMDTDRSGTITFEELKTGLSRLGSKLSELEIKQLMDAVDVDQNGTLDYTEFITATMQRHRLEKEENLFKAFQFFDKDSSGGAEASHDPVWNGDEATIDEVIDDVDTDKSSVSKLFRFLFLRFSHFALHAPFHRNPKSSSRVFRICRACSKPITPELDWRRPSSVSIPNQESIRWGLLIGNGRITDKIGFSFSKPCAAPISSSSSNEDDCVPHHHQAMPISSSKGSLDIPPPPSREISILEHLAEQLNIIEFKGAYEDKQNLHLVNKLCSGIVNVVHVCHFIGVMHRNLKPENFLMVSHGENSLLKATDFGFSVFIDLSRVLDSLSS